MTLEIDQPESIEGGGNFVEMPGIYHAAVTGVDEEPVSNDGKPLSALKLTLSILAGTVPSQVGRTFSLTLWHPSDQDNSDMPKKKLTCFAIATNLLKEHVPGQRASIDPSAAMGQQLVLKLAPKRKKNETTGQWEDTDRLDLAYADIWHVDDEAVSKNSVPLDQASLNLIPATLRKARSVASSPAAAANATAGASASKGPVDLAAI
jgi:hypothetical protein